MLLRKRKGEVYKWARLMDTNQQKSTKKRLAHQYIPNHFENQEDDFSFREFVESHESATQFNLHSTAWHRYISLATKFSVVIAVVCILIASPYPVNATPQYQPFPCSTSTSGFDGGENSNLSGVTAAKASIDTDNPAVCDGTDGTSSVWAMIVDSSGFCYAQTGWAHDYPYTTPKYFYETTPSCNGSSAVYLGTPSYPSTHNYEAAYDGNNTFHFYIDGTLVATVNPNTHWTPAGVEYLGEVHNLADQMPGTTGTYIYFQNVLWRKNGTWSSGNINSRNTFTYGGLWFPGGLSFGIYDTRY